MWEKTIMFSLFIAIFALGISMTNSYIIYRDDAEMQERTLDVVIERLTNQMTRDQVRGLIEWRKSLKDYPPTIILGPLEPCQMQWWEWIRDYSEGKTSKPTPKCQLEDTVRYRIDDRIYYIETGPEDCVDLPGGGRNCTNEGMGVIYYGKDTKPEDCQ